MGNGASTRFADDGDLTTSVSHPELSVPDALKYLQRVPHVRRGSLVLARNANGTARSPSFIVDAPLSGCRVAMYTFAREDETGHVHASGLPILALDFPAGAGQPFPGDYNRPISMAHLKDYIKPLGNRYPLVIRVESPNRRHVASQDLSALPAVGSQVTYYINVHTVFAHLKLNSGAWDIEVVKEHLWVDAAPMLLPSQSEVAAYQRQAPKARLAATPAQLKEQQQAQLIQQQQQQQQSQKQQQWLKQQQLLKKQQQLKQQQLLLQQQQQLQAAAQAYAQQQALYPGVSYAQALPQSLPLVLPTSQPYQLPPAAPLYAASQPLATAAAQPGVMQSPFAAGGGVLQSPFAGAGLAPQKAVRVPSLDDGWSDVASPA